MAGRMVRKRRLQVIFLFVSVSGVSVCTGLSVSAQTAPPDWEKAAGIKQQFEVASVRENKSGGRSYSNFSLDNGNAYFIINKSDKLDLNGTLFSAKNQSLMR